MKNLIIILTLFLFTPLLFSQSKEDCYVVVEASEEFNSTFLSNISVSIISQFLKEVEPIPPEGISRESCLYQISVSKQQDTTFVTFKGKNLNSYGDSKLSGTDGFQQSLIKSLFRALKNKRHSICEGYGELLTQCENIEVKTDQTEIYSLSQDTNKQKGILFEKEINGNWEWGKDGDEEKDGKYVGEIENGLPNGQGTQTWKNPFEKYEGEWKDGYRHGQGTIVHQDPFGKYVGEWKNGERNGFGKSVWSEPHQEHEGQYKNNEKNGFGTEIYEDGSKYVGNFTNHERDGQGTYYYTNGDKYVGEWKKSSVHGKGSWLLNNGDRWVGEMRNDKDWNTTGYDKNGNIIGRVVNGVNQ